MKGTGLEAQDRLATATELVAERLDNLNTELSKGDKTTGLASGGMFGPTAGRPAGALSRGTDTRMAVLTPGEFVVNRRATSKNRGLLQRINSGGSYAKGGVVEYLADGSGGTGGGGGVGLSKINMAILESIDTLPDYLIKGLAPSFEKGGVFESANNKLLSTTGQILSDIAKYSSELPSQFHGIMQKVVSELTHHIGLVRRAVDSW
jgi:hypothetical protein